MNNKLAHQNFAYLHQICPNILTIPRYSTPYNFTGKQMRGYLSHSVVVSKPLGNALRKLQSKFNQIGYDVVVYDAYRPHKAIQHYLQWIKDQKDYQTKPLYFPKIKTKQTLLDEGYLGVTRCPHSRGGSVDLSIIKRGKKLIPPEQMKVKTISLENSQRHIPYLDDGTEFMGTHFDFFDDSSHWDTELISEQAKNNRSLLLKVTKECGFRYYQYEWWHFYMVDQPYPQTYFDFDIL